MLLLLLATFAFYQPTAADAPSCSNGGYCVPPSACAPYYLESLYDPSAHCYLSPDTPGVCCPSPKKDAHGSPDLLAQPERPLGSTSHLEFDLYSLNHTAYFALQEIAWVTDFEG